MSACSTQASLAIKAASEPDDSACTAAFSYYLYITASACDNSLPWCTDRLGPDTAAMQTLPDGVVDKPLGKIQPAWRDRIAKLRLSKSGQLTKLRVCSTGPRGVVPEDTADAKTERQPLSASDSTNADVNGSCSSRD